MSPEAMVPGKPVRILFQNMTTATARKAVAQSAEADTGGGARDIRLSPYQPLRLFLEELFPRKGERGGTSVRLATASWGDGHKHVDLELWPPTASRPNEARIAKIHSIPSLANPTGDATRGVVLFVQDDSDIVWVRYATRAGLQASQPDVRDLIISCLDGTRGGLIATGYIDLADGGYSSWCRPNK